MEDPTEPETEQPPYTPRTILALSFARREAGRLGHGSVRLEHLVLGIIRQGESFAAELLTRLVSDIDALVAALEHSAGPAEPLRSLEIDDSPELRDLIVACDRLRRGLEHDWLGTDHFIMGLCDPENSRLAPLLAEFGVTGAQVVEQFIRQFQSAITVSSNEEAELLKALSRRRLLTRPLLEHFQKRRESEGFREPLVERGGLPESLFIRILEEDFSIPRLSRTWEVDISVLDAIPKETCRRHGVFPVGRDDQRILLAVDDPFKPSLEELRSELGLEVVFVLAERQTIRNLLVRFLPQEPER